MAIIVVLGLISFRTTNSLIENSSWISHTEEVISTLDDLIYRLEKAESAQGRFIFTGNEQFFKSYQEDIRTANVLHQHLVQLTVDNPQQQQHLRELLRLMHAKVDNMNSTIEERRSHGQSPGLDDRLVNEGKREMDEIQGKVAELTSAETQLLATRTDTQRRSAERSLRSILLGGAIGLLFLGIAGLVLQRDIRKRFIVERRLKYITALQRAVLNSATYAIISTDSGGKSLLLTPLRSKCSATTPAKWSDPHGHCSCMIPRTPAPCRTGQPLFR